MWGGVTGYTIVPTNCGIGASDPKSGKCISEAANERAGSRWLVTCHHSLAWFMPHGSGVIWRGSWERRQPMRDVHRMENHTKEIWRCGLRRFPENEIAETVVEVLRMDIAAIVILM